MAKRQVRSKAMPKFLSRSLQFDFQLPVPAREDLQADLKMGTIQKCSGKILRFYDGITWHIWLYTILYSTI